VGRHVADLGQSDTARFCLLSKHYLICIACCLTRLLIKHSTRSTVGFTTRQLLPPAKLLGGHLTRWGVAGAEKCSCDCRDSTTVIQLAAKSLYLLSYTGYVIKLYHLNVIHYVELWPCTLQQESRNKCSQSILKTVQEKDEGEGKQRKENSAQRDNLVYWLPLVR